MGPCLKNIKSYSQDTIIQTFWENTSSISDDNHVLPFIAIFYSCLIISKYTIIIVFEFNSYKVCIERTTRQVY